jgi:cytochrome c1
MGFADHATQSGISSFPIQEDTTMKNSLRAGALALAFTLLAAPLAARAAAPKTYQVTGPIVEVNDSTITVMKGKEKWEIARNKDTKVTGDLKVGAKVTIMYSMTAASIEAKEDKGAAKADKGAEKKK